MNPMFGLTGLICRNFFSVRTRDQLLLIITAAVRMVADLLSPTRQLTITRPPDIIAWDKKLDAAWK